MKNELKCPVCESINPKLIMSAYESNGISGPVGIYEKPSEQYYTCMLCGAHFSEEEDGHDGRIRK